MDFFYQDVTCSRSISTILVYDLKNNLFEIDQVFLQKLYPLKLAPSTLAGRHHWGRWGRMKTAFAKTCHIEVENLLD